MGSTLLNQKPLEKGVDLAPFFEELTVTPWTKSKGNHLQTKTRTPLGSPSISQRYICGLKDECSAPRKKTSTNPEGDAFVVRVVRVPRQEMENAMAGTFEDVFPRKGRLGRPVGGAPRKEGPRKRTR